MKKNVYIGILFMMIVFGLIGCSTTEGKEQTVEQQVSAFEIDEAVVAEILEQFDAKSYDRIVTTSITIAEMLAELGVELVGVPSTDLPMPDVLRDVTTIGSAFEPDMEVLTSLEPDLVISSKTLQENIEPTLEHLQMEGVYLSTSKIDDLKTSFYALGKQFQKEEEASEILQKIQDAEQRLVDAGEGKERQKVMLMIGMTDSYMLMNEKSYVGSLMAKANVENIVTTDFDSDKSYIPFSMENILVADPDKILLMAYGDVDLVLDAFEKELSKDSTWLNLRAYQEENVQVIPYDLYGNASIIKAAEQYEELTQFLFQ